MYWTHLMCMLFLPLPSLIVAVPCCRWNVLFITQSPTSTWTARQTHLPSVTAASGWDSRPSENNQPVCWFIISAVNSCVPRRKTIGIQMIASVLFLQINSDYPLEDKGCWCYVYGGKPQVSVKHKLYSHWLFYDEDTFKLLLREM